MASERRPADGRIIRVSAAVHAAVSAKRRPQESWDSLLRRLFGLPIRSRRSKKTQEGQKLFEGYVLRGTMKVYATKAKARGAAVVQAAEHAESVPEQPIPVREVL